MAAKFGRMTKINVRVTDLDAALALFEQAMGAERINEFGIGGGAMRAAQVRLGDTVIEFIAPGSSDSPLARVIAQRGQGVDSIAYEVESLAETVKGLEADGLQMVPGEKMGTAGGAVFVHPKSTFGVMFELFQASGD